jgi:hypothetical protein
MRIDHTGPARNVRKGRQVNAVETSEAVPFGQLTSQTTQRIRHLNRQVREPLPLELALD